MCFLLNCPACDFLDIPVLIQSYCETDLAVFT